MPWFFYDSNGNQLTAERGTQSVADGGTGATSFTDGGVLLGSGTGAITAMAALANGAIVVGDGTTDPVALAAFSSSTGTLNVASGGTGTASLTANGVLIGNNTSAVTAVALATKGQLLVGDGTGNPQALPVGATADHVLTVDSGEATGMKWAAVSGVGLGMVIALGG
tara:strand:- start:130 stop:630 length:501 start_codon:yes stop_codon:yes gene_type:complete